MSQLQFDHLVICANEIHQGVRWFEDLSGISMPQGGSHPLMGTHNHLSALSAESFIEIIATDPRAETPVRSRWFNLDSDAFQSHLQEAPCFATWVVGTQDLKSALLRAREAGIDAGMPVELTRDNLRWQIGLRPDGTLACDGVFPTLIQWPEDVNPVRSMPVQGLRLDALHLQHPQADKISAALQAIGADHLASVLVGEALLHAKLSVDITAFNYITIQQQLSQDTHEKSCRS